MRDSLTLHFADGAVLSAWESFAWRDEYTDPLGSLELRVAPPRERIRDYAARLVKGERVGVRINGVSQANMLVETVKTTISPSDAVTFSLSCKSRLTPMFEGSVVPPDYSFRTKADTPVSNIVLDIAAPYGFTTLYGDERANRDVMTGKPVRGQGPALPIDALKHGDAQAHEGETAYAMIARLITRLGVCLRCAHDGTLLLSRPNYLQAPSYTVAQGNVRDADPFVGSIELVDTNAGQFSMVSVRGQAPDRVENTRAVRPIGAVTAGMIAREPFWTYRSAAAPFKPKIITDKNARDRERCECVAGLAMGLPAKNACVLTGSVQGFTARSGSIWNVDTVATVHLEAIGLSADMWILSREFRQDRQGGQMTTLKLLPLGFLWLGEVPR